MESGPKRKSAIARRAGLCAVVAAALVTSGCAAGQRAETAEEVATADATEANIGAMQLRGLALEAPVAKPYYPEGADVVVTVVIVNSGTTTDRLTNITSSAFGTWSAYRSAAEATAVQNADDPLAEAESSSSPSASSSGSSAGSGSPGSASSEPTGSTPGLLSGAAGSGSIAASATGLTSLAVPSGSRVGFGTPEATGGLLVMKLTRALYPGSSIPIRFTFAKAGSKSVLVPVQLTAGANDSVIPEPDESSAEG